MRLNSEEDYPESLQYLPFMTLAILKNSAFKDGSDVPIDQRAALHFDIDTMGLQELDLFFRPRLYRIDDMKEAEGMPDEYGAVTLPVELNLSMQEILPEYIVLLDTGRTLVMRIGESVSHNLLTQLFGSPHPENINLGSVSAICGNR